MKLRRILLVFEDDTPPDGMVPSPVVCEFQNGQWTVNGPFYPRVARAMDVVYRVVKILIIQGKALVVQMREEV